LLSLLFCFGLQTSRKQLMKSLVLPKGRITK
jgi:hypothetical protein